MEAIEFLVQGSAPEPYVVRFVRRGSNLSAYCTCPAGQNGQYCKHRIRILSGDVEGVVSGNVADVSTVASWLEGTDVAAAMKDVVRLEDEAERIKVELLKAKKHLAKAFMD